MSRAVAADRSWHGMPGVLAAFCVAAALALSASSSQECGRCSRLSGPVHTRLLAGHGGGPAAPRQVSCPAILEAEGPVEEIELRDPPLRPVIAQHHARVADSRFSGRDAADMAVSDTALVANAADLGRLCRRLL